MSSLTTDMQLTELKAQALKAFSLKDYTTASDLYAKACELQSSVMGENNPKNGYLLHSYGRSLYEVALKRSDVLGGAPTQEDKKQKHGQDLAKRGEEGPARDLAVIEESEENPGAKAGKAGFFSITGDENWVTDDEDEDEQGEEDEGDGFALAWEILDLARVMFLKQLAASATESKVEGSTESTTPNGEANSESAPAPTPLDEEEIKRIKTALADTYDLLGEVSLESESFVQAAKDLRSSLDLKLELYPVHSTLISEAHFKLSLALEFSAAGENVSADDNKKGREDAAIEMEKAIESCKARIAKEEADISVENDSKSKEEEVSTKSLDEVSELAGELSAENDTKGKGKEVSTKSLDEAREMVAELEVRLADLRSSVPQRETEEDALKGLLGQVLGENEEGAKKLIREAINQANDLTSLVRKKPHVPSPTLSTTVVVPTNGAQNGAPKRKLEEVKEDVGEEEEAQGDPKKAKVDDGQE